MKEGLGQETLEGHGTLAPATQLSPREYMIFRVQKGQNDQQGFGGGGPVSCKSYFSEGDSFVEYARVCQCSTTCALQGERARAARL